MSDENDEVITATAPDLFTCPTCGQDLTKMVNGMLRFYPHTYRYAIDVCCVCGTNSIWGYSHDNSVVTYAYCEMWHELEEN